MADMVTVQIGGSVQVPVKFAEVVGLLNTSQGPETWQEVANQWVKMIRVMGAENNMSEDDLIAELKKQAQAAGEAP